MPAKKKKVEETLAPEELTIPEDEEELLSTEEALEAVDEEVKGEVWIDGMLIRVVDDEGHLLFKYNPATKSVEIKVPVGRASDKGKMFNVSTDVLRNAGATNFISNKPVFVVKAELMNHRK